MDRIIQILQKEYDRLEYAMKLGKSIGKENAPEYKQLETELTETGEAIKILITNADTGEKQCNLPVVRKRAFTTRTLGLILGGAALLNALFYFIKSMFC